jgi:hypothetical protein
MMHLSNASLELYLYANLLGKAVGASKLRGKPNKTRELICTWLGCIILRAFENRELRRIYLSMALEPFVGPWPLFQFLDLLHSR